MGKRSFERDCSGQVLIVSALLVAVLLLSTALYVIEVGKQVPTLSAENDVFSYQQTARNTLISALANVTDGGNPAILGTDLDELKAAILSNSYQAMITVDYALLNSGNYQNGTWVFCGANGLGISSAYATFRFESSSPSATSNMEYAVNVTSILKINGNYIQLNDTTKQVNLSIDLLNEDKAALGRNFIFSYQTESELVPASSPIIASFGNGTYTASFNAETEKLNDPLVVSLRCQDGRGIFVRANLTCTDTSVNVNSAPAVSLSPTSLTLSSAASVIVNVSPTVNIEPAGPITLDAGQSQIFTANSSGGSSPVSYQWYLNDSAITGQTDSTYLYTATLTSHTIYVRITDNVSTPVMTQSNIVSVTVNDAPTASIAPLSWIMDVGQSKTFTATAAGGSGTYSAYQWYVNSTLQSGQTNSTFIYSPISPGSYSITASVTDSLGATSAQSSATSVMVSALPTVNIIPVGPITLDAGQSQVFTANSSGGSGPLSYQWYLNDSAIPNATGSIFSFNGSAGSYSITCKVTDSASTPVTNQSNTVSVTVNDAPAASVPPPSGTNKSRLRRR